MNIIEKFKEFLENNEIRDLWFNKKDVRPTSFDTPIRLFKVNFGRFDYIYGIENIRNDKPTEYGTPFYCGVVDTTDNQLYIPTYNITEYYKDVKYISSKTLNHKLIDMLTQSYEEFAENVVDDLPDDAVYYNKRHAEDDYYYGKKLPRTYSINLHERSVNELMTFVENPAEYVKLNIMLLEQDNNKLTKHIKEKKLQLRLESKFFNEIETLTEYHYLRLAKKIREAIPQNAKTVNLFYKLNNGEICECKYETCGLNYMPYGANETLHFSFYNANKQARDKIEEVNGHSYNDFYIKNIEKITYNGKTLYEKNDKESKNG